MYKNNLWLKTNNSIVNFYHTTLRNVGLTTTISFAALAYSRFYRDKSTMYSGGLVFVSILTMLGSIILNNNLYNTIVMHHNINNKLYAANKYLIINKIFIVNQLILMFFAIYTLYRIITDNLFI